MVACALGDNLKLVPQGTQCTAERTAFRTTPLEGWPQGRPVTPFLGGTFVGPTGEWLPTAYDGMSEGATQGGVGLFGSERDHPLIDSLPAGTPSADGPLRRAVFYVRLPQPGQYDVCFSARDQRRDWKLLNLTSDQVPMWRKLWRCPQLCPAGVPIGDVFDQALARGTTPAVTVEPEPLGWTMLDVTENTWGPLRVGDGGRASLSRWPARLFEQDPARRNYWETAGGDAVKLVPAELLSEERLRLRPWPLEGRPLGSHPTLGCWQRTTRFWEDATPFPSASRDLSDDPTLPPNARRDDARRVSDTYFEPHTGPLHHRRYVCYRRAGEGEGWRVLPWLGPDEGLPMRWRHLAPPEGPIPQPLTSGASYQPPLPPPPGGVPPPPALASPPPPVRWYMNDTRAGTWGPLWVESANLSVASIDARPHQIPLPPDEPPLVTDRARRAAALQITPARRLALVEGYAVRIVPTRRSCSYPQFYLWQESSESIDGGDAECRALANELLSGCQGASADPAAAPAAAFWLLLPEAPGRYRVCVRPGGWNWREAWPADPGWRGYEQWAPEWMPRLTVGPPPTVEFLLLEQRYGMDAVIEARDPQGELSAARGGDVLRLVPQGEACDRRSGPPPPVEDAHLSLLCPPSAPLLPAPGGLLLPPCALDPATQAVLRCPSNGGCAVSAPLYGSYAAAAPLSESVGSIGPGAARSWAVERTAAYLPLPNPLGKPLWRVCYRQALVGPNWVVANASFRILLPQVPTLTPDTHESLVAGELREFELNWPPGEEAPLLPPLGLRDFAARLVPRDPAAPNDGCIAPPGSTDGEPFAASTRALWRRARDADRNRPWRLGFYITVPHTVGDHWLCVHHPLSGQEGGASWQRFGPYTVHDNRVRWWVDSLNTPVNRGSVLIRIGRCTPGQQGRCSVGISDVEWPLDTSPGGDAAKVVAAADGCHLASTEELRAARGPSVHVGVERASAGAAGVTDLGPADGPAEVATMVATLPAVAGDTSRAYKICLLASFASPPGERRRVWVEVGQADDAPQQQLISGGFVTRAGVVSGFSVAPALQPPGGTSGLPLQGAPGVVLTAGAVSRYSAGGALADGLTLTLHADLPPQARVSFKLVLAAVPRTRMPPATGEWVWDDVPSGSSCISPAAAGTHAGPGSGCVDPNPADGSTCPSLVRLGPSQLAARIQIPAEVGRYLCCISVNGGTWAWAAEAGGLGDSLYTVASMLHIVVPSPPPGVGTYSSNGTVTDLAAVGAESLAAWCGGTADCPAGADFIAITNASLVCPIAATPGLLPEWHPMRRTGQATAALATAPGPLLASGETSAGAGLFRVPPLWGPGGGRYKLCLLKGAEDPQGRGVSRAGVSYQLWNAASRSDGTGGQSGYYQVGLTPDRLLLETTLEPNVTGRFAIFDSSTAAAFDANAQPPEDATGFRSLSAVLLSGESFDVTVRLGRGSAALDVGSGAVWVEFCPLAEDELGIRCLTSAPADASDPSGAEWPLFDVWNTQGECNRIDGPAYGLPADGLRQQLRQGEATFRLQLRSACPRPSDPGSKLLAGCGVVFKAFSHSTTTEYTVASPPLWFNIRRNVPDAVAFDGTAAPSRRHPPAGCSGPPHCVVRHCISGAECVVALQSWRRGLEEFAPLGGYSLQTSFPAAHFTPESFPWQDEPWGRGGAASYSAAPQLIPGVAQSAAVVNITFGMCPEFACVTRPGGLRVSGWTALVIKVSRPQAAAVAICGLSPLDAGSSDLRAGRIPAPAWIPAFPLCGGDPSALSARARPGSYLEALVPYELTFAALGFSGEPLSDLDGWNVTLAFAPSDGDTQHNQLLRVELTADGQPAGTNMLTAPAAVQPWQAGAPAAAQSSGGDPRWAVRFRVLSNAGCSRWQRNGLGCRLELRLAFPGNATTGIQAKVLVATVDTAVRVPARTIRISVTSAIAPLSDGVPVVALPGTPSLAPPGFLHDEFHGGDLYMLLSSPGPIVDMATRDGTRLSPEAAARTPCSELAPDPRDPLLRPRWGAQWTLRTTRPCIRCTVTFHSTAAAGPEPAVVPGMVRDGELQASLVDEARGAACHVPAEASVAFESVPGTETHPFDLAVRAINSFGGYVIWPRWWTYIPTGQIVSLADGSTVGDVQLRRPSAGIASQKMGAGGVAYFRGLVLEGAIGNYREVRLTLAVIATSYNDSLEGTVPTGEARWPCKARIRLSPTAASPPRAPRRLRVASADGVEPLCYGPGAAANDSFAGCTSYVATAIPFRTASFSFDTLVYTRGEWVPDSTGESNATVGLGEALRAAKPRLAGNLTCASEADRPTCRTPQAALASRHPPISGTLGAAGAGARPVELSFGQSSVRFRLVLDDLTQTVFVRGRGRVTIELGGSPAPVRDALWAVCLTLPPTPLETPTSAVVLDGEDACLQLRLWLLPQELPQRRVVVFTPEGYDPLPATVQLDPGVGTRCGPPASTVALAAVVAYDWPSPTGGQATLYADYGFAVDFVLSSASNQALVNANDTSSAGRSLVLRGPRPAAEGAAPAPRLLAGPAAASALLSGLEPVTQLSAAPISVSAVLPAQPDARIDPGNSGSALWWGTLQNHPTDRFQVMAAPAADDDCTTRRHMPTLVYNYLSAGPDPGAGWGYSAEGGVVGVPLPVQVRALTADGARSYSHPPSLVLVSKQASGGCNDGGKVQIMSLRPAQLEDTRVLMDGADPLAFEELPGSAVTTYRGQATVWVNFSAPCQSCTLEVRLCYPGSTGVANCLVDTGGGGPPILSERTQVTTPFRVRPHAPAHPAVVWQEVPQEEEPIQVGAPFRLRLQAVALFGGRWAVRGAVGGASAPMAVWAGSLWTEPVATSTGEAARRYGNGGFLAPDSAGCGTDPPMEQPPLWLDASAAGPNGTVVAFHFTRPCSRCSVAIRVRMLLPGGTMGPPTTFHVRSADPAPGGATGWTVPRAQPAAYRVQTCPRTWLIALAPAAVRRRSPFSICALRVDAGNVPVWEGTAVAALAPAEGAGNGGGGDLEVSSPLVPLGAEQRANASAAAVGVQAEGGSVVVRLRYMRACWRCTVAFGALRHTMAVLTDATQVVITAQPTADPEPLSSPGMTALLRYTVFLADESGDRAYTAGGPTPLQWQPRWAQGPVAPLPLEVIRETPTPSGRLLMKADGSASAMRVVPTGSDLTVVNGSQVVNGLPFGVAGTVPQQPGDAGQLVIRAALTPLSAFVPRIRVGGKELPVSMLGGGRPRPVDWSLAAENIVVGNGSAVTAVAGDPARFEVRAVARRPGAAEAEDLYYDAVRQGGTVRLLYDCTRCVGCEPQAPTEVPMVRGRAPVEVIVPSGEGSCAVTALPPPGTGAAAAPQSLELRINAPAVVQWLWESSEDTAVVGLPTVASVRSAATAGGTHHLRLRSWTESLPVPLRTGIYAWSDEQLSALRLLPDPPGCLSVNRSGPPSGFVTVDGAALVFTVRFSTSHVRCKVSVAAGGVPAGTVAGQTLDFDIFYPAFLEVIPQEAVQEGAGYYNFTSIRTVTAEGDPAVYAGDDVVMLVRVADRRGLTALGDYSTRVEAVGWRDGLAEAEAAEEEEQTLGAVATAQAGVARLVLKPRRSTRGARCWAGCAGGSECCEGLSGPHRPWWLRITASRPGAASFDTLTTIGPLFVLASARRVRAEYRVLHGREGTWRDLPDTRGEEGAEHPPPGMVVGYPLQMRFAAVDDEDPPNVAAAPDDVGRDTELVFQPRAVPCIAADQQREESGLLWIQGTCTAGGGCLPAAQLPECGTNRWRLGPILEEAAAAQPDAEAARLSLYLADGRGNVSEAVYSGDDGVRAFSLTAPGLGGTAFVGRLNYTGVAALGLGPPGDVANISCRGPTGAEVNASRPRAAAYRCSLPRQQCDPPAGCRTVFFNASFDRSSQLTPNFLTTRWLARIMPGEPFALEAMLLDSRGRPVAAAIDTAFSVRGECVRPGWDGAEDTLKGFAFGVLGGVTGTQVVRDPPVAPVVQGVARWPALGFAGYCGNASLVIECLADPRMDTLKGCAGRSIRSEFFEVGSSTRIAPTPTPPDVAITPAPVPLAFPWETRLYPTGALRIGPVDFTSFTTNGQLNFSLVEVWKDEFELRMLADITRRLDRSGPRPQRVNLTFLCNLPLGPNGSTATPAVVTDSDRIDPIRCLDFGVYQRLAAEPRTALALQAPPGGCSDGCLPVVEFMILAGNVSRLPDVAERLFRAVRELAADTQGEIYTTYQLPPGAAQALVLTAADEIDPPADPPTFFSTPQPTSDAPSDSEPNLTPVETGAGRNTAALLAAAAAALCAIG
eukprot:TRINITY_DN2523_c2_g1_i1.p1 TRINITY_DN2523_c2_g1~~TRINITY_DN2523_c2_g1_i1.p1  ORF type:complete len:4942 (+),score=985.22 TRINITY_DN2523_c2_g1_i1:1998-14828(+)